MDVIAKKPPMRAAYVHILGCVDNGNTQAYGVKWLTVCVILMLQSYSSFLHTGIHISLFLFGFEKSYDSVHVIQGAPVSL